MAIEIPLAQGWARGARIVFEDSSSSKSFNLAQAFHVKQVHGSVIHAVKPGMTPQIESEIEADGVYAEGDWLKQQKVCLAVKSADCAPLIYFDHARKAIAVIHAGWRGLALGIHRKLFEEKLMSPATTWVWLGPCLNGESFEVGPDVWERFEAYQNDEEVFATRAHKKLFYAWRFLEKEFGSLGVELFYNVEVDTFTNSAYASYRRFKRSAENEKQRNISWIAFE